MARKPKAHHEEEHADETWLIPYSDILTLLLALFIVLFASSQIDQKKLEQLSNALNVAFNGSAVIFDREMVMETPPLPNPNQATTQDLQNMAIPKINIMGYDEKAYLKETAELLEVKRQMDAYIDANGLQSYLSTNLTETGLLIRIKETALFPSGSAELGMESRRLAEQIAKMLLLLTQEIVISGHTDIQPINTREFPSNWELSSRRAVNFMRLILSQQPTLNPKRFCSVGYGEYRPIDTNNTVEGMAANRRVEVLIMRNYKM